MQDAVTSIIAEVHERYAAIRSGALADYIPELTRVDPDLFGIVVVTADGQTYAVGDTDVPFTIQSVSKAFAYMLAVNHHGASAVEKVVDVEPSGEAFNSISLDPETGRPRNPMINAGAIAITGLMPEDEAGSRFPAIVDAFSRLAATDLDMDEEVYASESRTGFRNRAIAQLLRGADIISDPDAVVEDYFRQCSLRVTASSLAAMAATMANRGRQPRTGEQIVEPASVERALSVMSTCGMYDYSGTWMYDVGVPAKSGVGGGVVGVLPGQLAIAAFSPLLDRKGNSVRGVAAIRDLSRLLDLHLLRASSSTSTALRRSFRLSDVAGSRRRPAKHRQMLAEHGRRAWVIEVQGDLFAANLERLVREVRHHWLDLDLLVVDLTRAGASDESTERLMVGLARDLGDASKRVIFADPANALPPGLFDRIDAGLVTDSVDDAMLIFEEVVLHATDVLEESRSAMTLGDFELIQQLDDHARDRLVPRLVERRWEPGEVIVRQGEPTESMHLLAAGQVRVEVNGTDDQPIRVGDMYPGTVFGELGLLDQAPRSASVRAVMPVTTWVLTREALMEMRRLDHLVYTRVVEHFVVALAERLREVTWEIKALKE